MFNKQPFNRGKFNRSVNNANSVLFYGDFEIGLCADVDRVNAALAFSGDCDITLTADAQINYAASLEGNADIQLAMDGRLTRARLFEGNMDIVLSTEGRIVRARHFKGGAVIVLAASMTEAFNTFRYEIISLTQPGFIFRPGDELMIDMDNMTVTLNGQNVMRFVDRESEFFLFNPGNNEVTYTSTTTAGRVDIRLLWKDAFL